MTMRLNTNPLTIFKNSTTPAGLYAREKWLKENDTDAWKSDFDQCAGSLIKGQSADGSWNDSIHDTIHHLFGLHLTVRTPTPEINKGLRWLFKLLEKRFNSKRINPAAEISSNQPSDIPFVTGRGDAFLTGAALFLASIFGFENDPFILSVYHNVAHEMTKNKGLYIDLAASQNVFRALVVHPVFSASDASAYFVSYLANLQNKSGKWPPGVPFYLTVNALAHLDMPKADQQLEKAFNRIIDTQKKDGTWGQTDPEWLTFLTVHALKNKGLL